MTYSIEFRAFCHLFSKLKFGKGPIKKNVTLLHKNNNESSSDLLMASCRRMKSNKTECARCETRRSANSEAVWQTPVGPRGAELRAWSQIVDVEPSCLFLSLGRNIHTSGQLEVILAPENCRTSQEAGRKNEESGMFCGSTFQTLLNSCVADSLSVPPVVLSN